MRRIILAVSVVFVSARAFALNTKDFSRAQVRAAEKDPLMYTIDPKSIHVVKIGVMHSAGGGPVTPPSPIPGPVPPSIDPGNIINIGKEIWQIIQDNRPVVESTQSYATALPSGLTGWDQLQGWNEPDETVYEYTAQNPYGMTVVDVKFGVMRTWGGSYKGVGKYLTAVTTEPLLVDVMWGYKFTMVASAPKESIVNVGSKDAPIAAMEHRLNWSIQTVLREFQGTDVFYLRGDGIFKHKGGPRTSPVDTAELGRKTQEMLQEPIRW